MSKIINEIGNKYGRLTVLKETGRDKYGKALWLCKCDCGNTTIVSGVYLRNDQVKSCGCLRNLNLEKYNNRLPRGEAAFRRLLGSMKENAARRNLDWTLTDEEVRELIQKPCYYCGALPSDHTQNKRIRDKCRGDFPSNGLDRLDNFKGYTLDNVVPCCSKCNYMKKKMNILEFIDQVTNIYKHWNRYYTS